MRLRIITFLIFILLVSCTRKTELTDSQIPYIATKNVLIITPSNQRNIEQNEIQNAVIMALKEYDTDLPVKFHFLKYSNNDDHFQKKLKNITNIAVVIAFNTKIFNSLQQQYGNNCLKIIVSKKEIKGNNSIWIKKNNLEKNINFAVKQIITSQDYRALWIDYTNKNHNKFNEEIVAQKNRRDFLVDHIVFENQEKNYNYSLKTDVILTNISPNDFSKLSGIKYKKLIFLNMSNFKISDLNLYNKFFFICKNYDFFYDFSNQYFKNFGYYPSIFSTIIYDISIALLSNLKDLSRTSVYTSLKLSANKDIIYVKNLDKSVDIYSY